MKRRITIFVVLVLIVSFINPLLTYAYNYNLNTNSNSLIVINAHNGEVLLEKGSEEKINTSTLIPVIVALTVYDRKNLDEYILIDDVSTNTNVNKDLTKINSSNTMQLQFGEKMKIRDLLTLVLIDNNQSAIRSLAKSISNSEVEFAKLCNAKAQDLELNNTIITGVINETAQNDYTTVQDIAKATRVLSNITPLIELCFVTSYSFAPTNIVPEQRVIYNSNEQILPQSKYYYQDLLTGINTSKTINNKFSNTYVGIASKNSNRFIVALNNGKDEKTSYVDSKTLFDWSFNNYTTTKLITKNSKLQEWPLKNGEILDLVASTDFYYTTPKESSDYQEVKYSINFKPEITSGDSFKKDQLMGISEILVNGTVVGQVPLVASRDVTIVPVNPELEPNKYDFVQQWLIRILILFLLLAILIMLIRTYLKYKRSKIKRARLVKRKYEYLENKQISKMKLDNSKNDENSNSNSYSDSNDEDIISRLKEITSNLDE